MQVKVVIMTTLDLNHNDVPALKQAGVEQVLQTAKMQGAAIHISIDPQRRAKAPRNAAQGVSTNPADEEQAEE